MIKQFSTNHTETLKRVGSIEFRVSEIYGTIVATTRFLNMPHRVVYVQRDKEPQHLFDCAISYLNTIISVNDIARPKNDILSLTKEQEYLLLGLVVDAAIDMAISQGRKKIVVTSNVPYIADILVDRDFVTKSRKTYRKGYRGVKILNTARRKDKDEGNHSEVNGEH